MEKALVIPKTEIKQEVEEVSPEKEEGLNNSNFVIKPETEDASLQSNQEPYEWTIPVFINTSANLKNPVINVRESKMAKSKQKPKDLPEQTATMVASNSVEAQSCIGQNANNRKGRRTRASEAKFSSAKHSIELVLVQEEKCNFDKIIIINHETKNAIDGKSDALANSNSEEVFDLSVPPNSRKRRRKSVVDTAEVSKTVAMKVQNKAKRDLKQKKDKLNLSENGRDEAGATKLQDKILQNLQKTNATESIETEDDNNKNESESDESVSLSELKNHIKENRIRNVTPKKKLQKSNNLKMFKNNVKNKRNNINLKVEKINRCERDGDVSISNMSSNFHKTAMNMLKQQDEITTNNVNLNNNNTDIESVENRNKFGNLESEESDAFQEHFEVGQRKKRKYTPRRKPELTEEQKAEIERQKLERRTCTICGRVFAFPGILQSHIRSKHTFEKPYSCEFCSDKFARRSSYLAHRSLHIGIKPHLCNICGKTFLRKASLHLHMRVHVPSEEKIRDVKCKFCPNVYTSKLNLTKHLLTKHTDPRDWKHECHVCHKKCFSTTDLTHHLRRHNDDRNYKCVICGRGFFTKQTMDVHVRTHSASTAFNCEHCSNGYRSNEALQRHLLKVHSIGEEKPISMPTHFCPVCTEGFRQRAGLEKHLVFHETGEEEYPFECQKCDKRYKARNYFTIHMLDKHKVFIDDAYFKAYFNSGSLKP